MKQLILSMLAMIAVISNNNAQNVGIGTATPAEKLEVTGNIRLSLGGDRTIAVSSSITDGVSGNSLFIRAGDAKEGGAAAGGGNVEIKAGFSNDAGSQNGGHIILTAGQNKWNNGLNPAARNGDIIFRNAISNLFTTELARLDGTTGFWGFGKTSPTARVDVAGTVKATGFQLTTGAAANKVLVSDANGVASWGDVTGAETDPQVGANTTNYLSKWNGTALVASTIVENGGNVGIGVANPGASLQLANHLLNRRLVLFDGNNNDHQFFGFGVNNGAFRYQAPTTAISHVFYAGLNSSTSVELMRIQGDGKVGIGNAAPAVRLDVSGTGGLRVSSSNPGTGFTDWVAGNLGGTAGDRVVMGNLNGTATIGAHNNALNAWANLSINQAGGNVGIGMATPHATLQLGNIISNRRFVMWEDANNDHQFYGMGVNASVLRYQVPGTAASHIFYAGTNTSSSNELLRIQGDGDVGVGTATPAAMLDVNGDFKLGKTGTVLNQVTKATIPLPAKVFVANASSGATYAVSGAATGGSVLVSPSSPLPNGLVIAFAFVSSNGNVDVVFCNTLGGNINYPGGINMYITVVN